MIDELRHVLERTGRLNMTWLARRCADRGVRITQRQLIRWFHGHSTPRTTTPVELVARAANVDLAFLYPERPIPFVVTDRGRAALAGAR